MINERSEFFRDLSEKSEYERPGPAKWSRFWVAYISETVDPISRGIGLFKLPWTQLDWAHLGGGGGHPGR